MTVRLVPPHREDLAGYEAALATSWSPNNLGDVSAEQLAAEARFGRFRDIGQSLHLFLGEVLYMPGLTILEDRVENLLSFFGGTTPRKTGGILEA